MEALGDRLRVRRIEAGLTCKDVYRKLRIPVDFIQAVEGGTWDALPPPVYAAGFLKTYCDFLGLDPGPYVGAVHANQHAQRHFLPFGVPKNPRDRPAWLNEAMRWATVMAIAILGWGAYTIVVRPDTVKGPTQVQAETLDLRLPRLPEGRP